MSNAKPPPNPAPANPRAKSPDTPAEQAATALRHVWLAGLGTLAQAQAQGSKVFETMIDDGLALQRRTQSLATEQLSDFSAQFNQFTQQAQEVAQGMAVGRWDKLEDLFEARVARAMHRLNVPSQDAFDALRARVHALEAEVGRLQQALAAQTPIQTQAPQSSAAEPARPTPSKSPTKTGAKTAARTAQAPRNGRAAR